MLAPASAPTDAPASAETLVSVTSAPADASALVDADASEEISTPPTEVEELVLASTPASTPVKTASSRA